jgi:hypothetical protein
MRFKNSYAAAVAAAVSAVVFSAAFQPAEASFIFYAEQVGSNVVLTGQGSFNTTLLASTGTSTSTNFPAMTAVAIASQSGGVNITGYSGTLSSYSTAIAPGATFLFGSASGSEFLFNMGSAPAFNMSLPTSYTANAPLSTGLTVTGSLAGLGWSTAGTWASPVQNSSFTLPSGDTIKFVSVPEPTHMVFVAGIGAALGAWRLRRLRRNRMTAGDSIAG